MEYCKDILASFQPLCRLDGTKVSSSSYSAVEVRVQPVLVREFKPITALNPVSN